MLVTVDVAVALSRPPREDRWSRVIVEAKTPHEGELLAVAIASGRPDVVMPVRSQLISWS